MGLDVLTVFCCIIDLSKSRLIFRDLVRDTLLVMPKIAVNVQGNDVELEVDTGAELVLTGSESLAKRLNLPLEAVERFSVMGIGYTGPVPFVAKNLCVKAYGREMWRVTYFDYPAEAPVSLLGPLLGVMLF